ncbi:MAG: T9SS type A sorting domain-containing protein, partial [Chitinophagales bacterium]
TYFGSSNSSDVNYLVHHNITNGNGKVYVVSLTSNFTAPSNYPTLAAGTAYFQSFKGWGDGAITAFESNGELFWSTFLGGDNDHNPYLWGDGIFTVEVQGGLFPSKLYVGGNFSANDLSLVEAPYGNSYAVAPTANLPISTDAFIANFCIPILVTTIESPDNIDTELVLYPNPTSDILNIAWQSHDFVKIKLFNYLGQTLKNYEITSKDKNEITVDVSDLPQGVFFVQIETSNKMAIKEFIHQ